jgi:pSer/pThr/pTyr-binding forkhead associated (FHA) protein
VPGWILKSSDPEMTLRLPESGIRTVGRSARAEFIVEAALVSRLHCRLTSDPASGLLVEDLESTNGILVNGAKVDKSTLVPGDVLSVGRVDFTVERA